MVAFYYLYVFKCDDLLSINFFDRYILILISVPTAFGLIAIVLGVISRNISNNMESKRSQRYSDIGLLLAIISIVAICCIIPGVL